ncbi:MAG: sigma-70 family RNA polymerase sigma factor [bacterium]|nr:sigma-70 family RNA polymerase sigma factor [bacterium]
MHETFVERIRCCYAANRQDLYTYALALTRSQEAAEDAIHTAFANVLQRRRCKGHLRPYLFRCVRNAAIDEHRVRDRHDRLSHFLVPPDAGEACVDDGRAEELRTALEALGDPERECIVLKTFSGLTFREIGRVMKASPNTTASWYRRGLAKLKALLTEDTE